MNKQEISNEILTAKNTGKEIMHSLMSVGSSVYFFGHQRSFESTKVSTKALYK